MTDFPGGDHLHLVVPRRPEPRGTTNAVMFEGDTATPLAFSGWSEVGSRAGTMSWITGP